MDGAYYALKGYAYQFDKSILDILGQEDENQQIGIEKIQDIDSDDYVTQVKYREARNYSATLLREPVLQLVEEYKNHSDKNYILYCHFKDKDSGDYIPSKTDLESMLAKIDGTSAKAVRINGRLGALSEETKGGFLKKFKVVFAPPFQEQFVSVLDILKLEHPSASEDEIIFHYSQIEYYLIRLVIDHPREEERICTKAEILKYISNTRKVVFTSSFEEFKGKEAYFNFVRGKFELPRKDRHNFIFLGNVVEDDTVSVIDLVDRITENYYLKAMVNIKPLVFVIDEKYVETVKKGLIQREILFNDGYEQIYFSPDIFGAEPVANKVSKGKNKSTDSLSRISFKIRIIGMGNVEKLTETAIVPNMIYGFDTDVPEYYADIPQLKVDNLNTQQLLSLFT